MKKIQILGAVFFAALAVGVVLASSAFAAEDLWLLNGASINGAAGVEAKTEGHLLFLILGAPLGTFHVVCSGVLLGKVGPGKHDLVEKVTDLEGKTPLKCEVLHSELGGCSGSLTALVTAQNLPWETELLLKEPKAKEFEFVDHFREDAAVKPGEPAFELECTTIAGKLKALCKSKEILTDPLINLSGGTVFGHVLNELSESCSISGVIAHLTGEGTISSAAGSLSVSTP
jgi:hypothetical protein